VPTTTGGSSGSTVVYKEKTFSKPIGSFSVSKSGYNGYDGYIRYDLEDFTKR